MKSSLIVAALAAGVCLPSLAQAQNAAPSSTAPATTTTGHAGTPSAARGASASQAGQDTGDIVVTAQRREERLQRVPISITALGSAQLETRGVRSVSDFARTPINSLTVQPFAGNPQILLLDLRGITTSDPGQGTIEPGVAIYEDDIYVSRAQAAGNTLSDPERIEVLRGPQGTLFGRNAEGGAIRIVTKRPTGVFGGDFRVSVGEYGNRHYIGHLNLPEVAGFSVKLDVLHDNVGGYVKNGTELNSLVAHQNDFGYQNNTGFRGAVRFKPTSNLTFDYSYTHLVTRVSNDYFSLTNPGARAPASYPQFLAPIRGSAETNVHDFNDTSWTGLYQDVYRSQTDAHAFTAQYDVTDRLQLKSVTGYRKLAFSGSNDLGGAFAFVNSPFLLPAGSTVASLNIQPAYSNQSLGIPGTTPVYAISGSNPIVNGLRSRAFSEELQLIGSTDTLQYQFGAYYYHENVFDARQTAFTVIYTNPTYTNFLALNPFQLRGAAAGPLGTGGLTQITAKARTIAGYGQVTWSPDFADGHLHLTGGLRYTDDKKDFLRSINNGAPANDIGTPFRASRFDPMGTIAYDFTPDINVYARYATGYKAGGVSVRSPQFRPFGLESVQSYEAGLKSQFFDRRMTFNVALFQNDIRNRQLNFQPDPLAAPSLVDTVNTPGTTRVRGVEVELGMRPTRNLSVSLNGGYTTFRLPAELLAINAALPLAARGVYTVQNTPQFQTSASVDWTMLRTDDNKTLNAHVDYAFADNVRGTGRIAISQFMWPVERHQGNARLTLDGLKFGPTTARISIYVNNFTDEIYPIYSAPSGNYAQNQPRQFGGELGVRF